MKDKTVILTGAAGGIGSEIAHLMVAEGAKLCLSDIDDSRLQALRDALPSDAVITVAGDINDAQHRARIVSETVQHFGGIDVLVNLAGINPFGIYADQEDELIQKTLQINAIGPMLLTRAVLPTLLKQNSGQIVNIGSIFGSIGFAWFTAYSASKFALRGFSQALRRELAESGIKVSYIAPRGVKTAINSQQVYDMAAASKMHMDKPSVVAKKIVKSIKKANKERYLGFPESLFVRINALLPGVVDSATRKQNRDARQFAVRTDP